MKFRYYITDLFDGVVRGTNDEAAAKNYALRFEYSAVDSQEGVSLRKSGEADDIKGLNVISIAPR